MKKSFTAIIIVLLVSVPGFLHAQIGKDPADSLQEYFDSVKIETVPVQDDTTVDEDEETTSNDEERKPDYFQPRSMPGAGYDTLQLRRISDSQKSKMSHDENFWYANYVFKKKKAKNQQIDDEPVSNGNPFSTLIWILIIAGFVAFLVLYLSNSNVKLFRSSKTIADEEAELETEDIFAINYQKEIDKAVAAGNYRLAVRLLYLRLLRRLSEKNVIQYSQEKTNFDYLMQTRSTVWYKPFFTLTRHYEYVWYGLFDVDGARFNVIKNDFAELENQL